MIGVLVPPDSEHRSPRFCSSHFYRHACAPMVHAHMPSTGSRTCAQSRRPPLHPPQTSIWAQLGLGHCRDATLDATWTDRVLCPCTHIIYIYNLSTDCGASGGSLKCQLDASPAWSERHWGPHLPMLSPATPSQRGNFLASLLLCQVQSPLAKAFTFCLQIQATPLSPMFTQPGNAKD